MADGSTSGCGHLICRLRPDGGCASRAPAPLADGTGRAGRPRAPIDVVAMVAAAEADSAAEAILGPDPDKRPRNHHANGKPKGRPKGARDLRPRKSRKRSLLEAFAAGRRAENAKPLAPFDAPRPEVEPLIADAAENRRAEAAAFFAAMAAERERRFVLSDRRECIASFAWFVRKGWRVLHGTAPLYWSWHMQASCDHAQALIEDLIRARREATEYDQAGRNDLAAGVRMTLQNLLVNIPPRSAKSMIFSVYLPAWAWLRDASLKVRCVSGNPKVTARDSRYCREVIGSKWYTETFRIEWKIRSDVDAVWLFENSEHGQRHASTFAAKVTGEGTDIIIVDDPHDAQQVNSDVQREAVIEKWDAALHNRVNNPLLCVRIGVMQRLHELDWAGHVLAQGGWEHLKIPMEYEPKQVCKCDTCARGSTWLGWKDPRTEAGALLQADRFPLLFLEKERVRLGSYGYAGQHQQSPAPPDGGMILKSWFHSFDELPTRDHGWAIYVDLNAKKTQNGSRTCIQVWVRFGPLRFLVDEFIGITTPSGGIEEIRKMRKKYPKVRKMVIEDKANGPNAIEALSRDFQGVVPWSPGSDSKESRAVAVIPQLEAGNVFIPRNAPWRDDFLHEQGVFPLGARDDQVDTLTMALIDMMGSADAARFRAAYGKKKDATGATVKTGSPDAFRQRMAERETEIAAQFEAAAANVARDRAATARAKGEAPKAPLLSVLARQALLRQVAERVAAHC